MDQVLLKARQNSLEIQKVLGVTPWFIFCAKPSMVFYICLDSQMQRKPSVPFQNTQTGGDLLFWNFFIMYSNVPSPPIDIPQLTFIYHSAEQTDFSPASPSQSRKEFQESKRKVCGVRSERESISRAVRLSRTASGSWSLLMIRMQVFIIQKDWATRYQLQIQMSLRRTAKPLSLKTLSLPDQESTSLSINTDSFPPPPQLQPRLKLSLKSKSRSKSRPAKSASSFTQSVKQRQSKSRQKKNLIRLQSIKLVRRKVNPAKVQLRRNLLKQFNRVAPRRGKSRQPI